MSSLTGRLFRDWSLDLRCVWVSVCFTLESLTRESHLLFGRDNVRTESRCRVVSLLWQLEVVHMVKNGDSCQQPGVRVGGLTREPPSGSSEMTTASNHPATPIPES